MNERRDILWRWVRAAIAVGVPAGVVSGAISHALQESLAAETSARQVVSVWWQPGPSTLVLLAWGVCGYLSAVIADRRLGVGALLAMIVSGSSGIIALIADVGTYRVLSAGPMPPGIVVMKPGCLIAWLAAAAWRTYVAD